MNIVITGGGTGGHLFPGVAIAQEFKRLDPDARILFMGTSAGIEARVLPGLGFPLATVPASGFKGKGPGKKLRSLAAVPRSVAIAARALRGHGADVVLGMGGYVSFPGIAAAKLLGIPAAIHEQNSVPGLSNRMLAAIADRVFISYEESRPFFSDRKTVFSGMPVRLPQRDIPPAGKPEGPCVVFIFGGSQGAHAVNLAVMEALGELATARDRLRFIHQTGAADAGMVAQAYAGGGFDAAVHPFIDDMYGCYGQADLIVSRSGASTLAEIALCGRPSVLLPLAHAAHNHQELNARAFVDRGAAVMLRAPDLDGPSLAGAILGLAADRERRSEMARRALELAMPDAARCVADGCRRLAEGRRK